MQSNSTLVGTRGVDGLKNRLSQMGVDFDKIPYEKSYPVQRDMEYTGRKGVLSQISYIIHHNIRSHHLKLTTKQEYQF
jgi:hypothetical protein